MAKYAVYETIRVTHYVEARDEQEAISKATDRGPLEADEIVTSSDAPDPDMKAEKVDD